VIGDSVIAASGAAIRAGSAVFVVAGTVAGTGTQAASVAPARRMPIRARL